MILDVGAGRLFIMAAYVEIIFVVQFIEDSVEVLLGLEDVFTQSGKGFMANNDNIVDGLVVRGHPG